MISKDIGDIMDATIKDLMIPGDKVAHVQIGNNLEHALLVLTKTGYTAIPVLDPTFKLHGLIGMNLIMDNLFGLERIEFEKLENMKVEEVMNTEIPRLFLNDSLEKGLDLVVNHNFVCVQNDENVFEGIFTRRAILKQLKNHNEKLKNSDNV
ncbi:cyclic-di-AMP-binding protein CbpB [Metabacillus sediminilitoris]|uniref:CBS domain-containing protein n=1 Tax=Metabacillus sediminilitoris TaxID=2567941 RepID=A0A4S4BYS0_9BACI|nr:cyclic-di-AMP-binding protein CbpB [Metabacillus sediminilitoris]QGQ47072.1 CBS domain-containing protein [Metabacillus sediminilitoris]THF80417.1 CBS domain-containing protein [Metabacillus sediminilitoris]